MWKRCCTREISRSRTRGTAAESSCSLQVMIRRVKCESLGFCFADTELNYRREKKILHPNSTPVCRNNFEQFLETRSLLCESFLRSPQGVTWLGSNAADQGALGSMSHLMRCQTKCDALANDARSSIASTRQIREGQKQGKK